VHDFAYKVILITGLAVIVMNLNPLLKLDGYYFLTELIGIPDFKERSTSFVSGWFQSRVLRLPAEVPSIPRRRVPLFVLYAIVSGAYSYLVLFTVLRLSYNVTSKLMAEFALIPVGAAAFVMFRSRIDSLRRVLKDMWRAKVGTEIRLRPGTIGVGIVLLILLFAPILRTARMRTSSSKHRIRPRCMRRSTAASTRCMCRRESGCAPANRCCA
jgi:putative peptide zinc metalloprotease protein